LAAEKVLYSVALMVELKAEALVALKDARKVEE
jgi:hypothetical protein